MSPSGFSSDTPRYASSMYGIAENEVESQDSINETTMSSEPISPPLDGFPHVEDFDKLIER